MHSPNLDACFYLASHGNKEAYQKLYEEFRKRAEKTIKIAQHPFSNLSGNQLDFSDITDCLFFKIINEYDRDRGPFKHFMEYTLSHRLTSKVQNTSLGYTNLYAPIDDLDELNIIEAFSDPNQPSVPEEIAIKNFKARISSHRRTKTIHTRTVDRILALQYLGYSNKEICDALKLTSAKYRNYLKKIQTDKGVINFKLEMK